MIKFLYTLILGVWVGATISFAQNTQTLHASVYFKYKKAQLNDESRRTLDKMLLIAHHKKVADYGITLTGVADSVGTITGNYALAKKRALVAKEYLTNKGLQADKIEVKVLGERPASNEDEHHKNRRVEVVLRWQRQVAIKKDKPKDGNILELFEQVKKRPQTFVIDNHKDTILTGKEGTRILLYANSFYTKRGQETVPVTLQLTEYYSYNDMILANLSTTSGKRLLETGGMFYIKATRNGKEARLRLNKNITLSLPSDNLPPTMQVFNGKRDDNAYMNWALNARGMILCLATEHEVCWLKLLFSRLFRRRYRKRQERWAEAAPLMKNANKNAYIMSTNRLGWINVDAFAEIPRKKRTQPKIKSNFSIKNTRYYLALHKRQSIVSGYPYHYGKKAKKGNTWGFGVLPKNERATLIVLRYIDKKVLIASRDVSLGSEINNDLAFTTYTVDEAKNVVQKLTAFNQPVSTQGK